MQSMKSAEEQVFEASSRLLARQVLCLPLPGLRSELSRVRLPVVGSGGRIIPESCPNNSTENEWTVIIHSSATVIQFSIQQFFKRTYALNKWAPLPMGNVSRRPHGFSIVARAHAARPNVSKSFF